MGSSRYSILIICEGENTEPLFFNSIRDGIINKEFDVDVVLTISPEPRVETQEKLKPVKHKKKRKKRALKQAKGEEPEVITGAPPLKWVNEGIKQLKNGTYNEVWVVFDHDDHPTRKEAFDKAEENIINDQKVRIAFSSRSFEYYLLLHFERLFKSFPKTECKEDKTSINCGSRDHHDDCMGEICINGYARAKEYWSGSKNNSSMFPIIKDKIEIAFENSAWLRFQSEIRQNDTPIYDRNPYVTTDLLVGRLTNPLKNWMWISIDSEINGLFIFNVEGLYFGIRNISSNTIIIKENSFFIRDIDRFNKRQFGKKHIISPNETVKIEVEADFNPYNEYVGFEYNNDTILFELKV